MMKKIVFTFFILIPFTLLAQTDYAVIDAKSKTVPSSLRTSSEIAKYLTKDIKTDKGKARAIYIWIAHNIQYDLSLINKNINFLSDKEVVEYALSKRKGICMHYAALFLEMCKTAALEAYTISGYTKDYNGEIANLSHAWNGIRINDTYYLVDVTWSAGYAYKGKYVHKFRDLYFLKSPKDFIKNHISFDPVWQFLNNPINNKEFYKSDFAKLDSMGTFSFKDSIRLYNNQNDLERIKGATRRIRTCGIANSLIREMVDYYDNRIASEAYNKAIELMNSGVADFNLYVHYKNRGFRKPKISDERIQQLIDNSGSKAVRAQQILSELHSNNIKLSRLIINAKKDNNSLLDSYKQEKAFVAKYLKKWKLFRGFML
ncbi:transglutaminase domain-containing protein [Wenyingzhuangia sp. IMCC45574]